jgi:two-component system, chemotaxis family, chemotaxis protein CheY
MAKIMVVDDSSLMRKILSDIIIELGHIVIEACEGEESIELYKKEHPDIVFMDIIMNLDKKNGINALKSIKSYDPNAIIIMCTSIGDQDSVVKECVENGAVEYICKPFLKNEIIKAINNNIK